MMFKQPVIRGLPSEDRLSLAVALVLFFAAAICGVAWTTSHRAGDHKCPASDFVFFNGGF
jgi:hypothetical protein